MIRVRRHSRQLASGKTTTVTQHERNVTVREREELDAEWRDRQEEPPPPGADGDPEGTVYFRRDDEMFAVHPDGTVHHLEGEAGEAEQAAEQQEYDVTPMDRLLGTDTPQGRERYRRLSELRDSGYTGPVDQDGYAMNAPAGRNDFGNTAFTRMAGDMREWRSRPEPAPGPEKPMHPALASALGCDTPEGKAKYDRLRAYREAGYEGPLDQDNNIPDPDDPANFETLHALAALRETGEEL